LETGTLGRRKFNKAKIERWRRIEGAIGVRLPAGLNNIPGNFGNFNKFQMLTQVKESSTARPITLVAIIRNIPLWNNPTGTRL
jgi:hypothetical protein